MYTKEHEWAKISGDLVRIGITDYAAKTLSDVVYLTLPSAGQTIEQLKTFGTVESIKAVSELYSPFTGQVKEVNAALSTQPELVNKSPYDEGWILEVQPSKLDTEKRDLLDARQYKEFLKTLRK